MTSKLFHTIGGFYRLARPTIKTIHFFIDLDNKIS
jgi:hypothetical protein